MSSHLRLLPIVIIFIVVVLVVVVALVRRLLLLIVVVILATHSTLRYRTSTVIPSLDIRDL